MKTNKILTLFYSAIVGILFAFVLSVCLNVAPEKIPYVAAIFAVLYVAVTLGMNNQKGLIGQSNILYYNTRGKAVYDGSRMASGATSDNIQAAANACVCGDVKAFDGFEGDLVLNFDNGSGGPLDYYIPPAMDFYEVYNNQSATPAYFIVQNFPFGNGTITQQDGTLLFGTNVLRDLTRTMALVISSAEMTGSFVGTATSKFVNVLKGNLFSAKQEQMILKASQIANNAVNILRWEGLFYWTANKGLQIAAVPTATTGQLTLRVEGVKFYNEPI